MAVGGIGHIGNIDHLDSKPRIQVFDWKKGERLGDVQGEGRGMVETLVFHPGGDWLLGAGGYSDGFLLFSTPDGSKSLGQVKAPMYLHDLAPDAARTTLLVAGHRKVARLRIEPADAG